MRAVRYHMGCGEQRIEGYVGVDIRATPVAELVLDLNEPKLPEGQQADVFFSHAFFEHLRRDARTPHLAALRGSLAPDGVVCYIGLPDFERIAQLYLEAGRGSSARRSTSSTTTAIRAQRPDRTSRTGGGQAAQVAVRRRGDRAAVA